MNVQFHYGKFEIGGNHVETLSNRRLQVCCIYMCHYPCDDRSYQDNYVLIPSFSVFSLPFKHLHRKPRTSLDIYLLGVTPIPGVETSLMSISASRDAPRGETNQQFGPLKSLPRKPIKIGFMKGFSTVISPAEHLSATKIIVLLIILSLVRLTPSIAALSVPPC